MSGRCKTEKKITLFKQWEMHLSYRVIHNMQENNAFLVFAEVVFDEKCTEVYMHKNVRRKKKRPIFDYVSLEICVLCVRRE